jgi:hypothetical protein
MCVTGKRKKRTGCTTRAITLSVFLLSLWYLASETQDRVLCNTQEHKNNSLMAKTTEVTMDRQEFNHDLNDIQFASHKDLYRAKIGSTSEGTKFWLENKKDKSQWQSTVKDVSTAGSGGVLPEEVIIESVKVIVQPL